MTRKADDRVHLSEREHEVLFLAAEGLTDKEISARLEIRTKTVRTYWDRIRGKLGAASRTQALALALRAALDDLSEKEERLRTFVSAMPVAFLAFDEDLTVVACNREAEKLTGYSEAELRGTRSIYGLAIPKESHRNALVRHWRLSKGEFRNWEIPVTRKDGAIRTISWSSSSRHNPVPGWKSWAIGFDVTDFQESQAKLRFLVQSAREGLWLLRPDFTTDVVNERMAEILGANIADLASTTPLDYIAEEDLPAAQAAIAAGGAEGVPFRFRRCDGQFVNVTKWLRPVLNPTGEVVGFLIMATERSDG